MHEHREAQGVVAGHPLFRGLDKLPAKSDIPSEERESIGFLVERFHFAYPRTLWLKLNADTMQGVLVRQQIEPAEMGRLLNGWLGHVKNLRRIVFDLRGVAFIDVNRVTKLFKALEQLLPESYYLCDGGLAAYEPLWREIPSTPFLAEEDLLQHLRTIALKRGCRVPLPPTLDLESLDEALEAYATPEMLESCDSVIFDTQEVVHADFASLVMLPGIAHSLGHKYGVLTEIDRTHIRRRVKQALRLYAPARVAPAHLITVPEDEKESEDWPDGLRLTCFTDRELFDVNELFRERFDSMVRGNGGWFLAVARLQNEMLTEAFDKAARVVRELRKLVGELLDNVAHHSGGVGYVAMELDPAKGLSIYVGDCGMGLQKALTAHYASDEFRDDAAAVAFALRLKEIKECRRDPGGRGLEAVALILSAFGGEIQIRSGSAMAKFAPRASRKASQTRADLYWVQGTHIHVFIPSEKQS